MVFKQDEVYKEQTKFKIWVTWTILLALLTFYVLAALLMPIPKWIIDGLDIDLWHNSVDFWKKAFTSLTVFPTYKGFLTMFFTTSHVPWPYYILFLPIAGFLGVMFFGIAKNPHEYMPQIFGAGRLAEYKDVKQMKLFDGFIMVLGRFKGKLLKLPETLACLAVAPPGTGKTAGIVIPTIFNSEGISIIVNDPKPELCYNTTGYRNTIGPVFVINWGAEDDPEKGIYFPSWNPLSLSFLPPMGPPRDMYIDSMTPILVEDPKGNADPHWSKTGRAAMTGFLHFMCSKCERAIADDYFVSRLMEGGLDAEDKDVLATYYTDMAGNEPKIALDALRNNQLTIDNYVHVGTWDGLPDLWKGHEPCIAMILDWITEAQMSIALDIKRRAAEGDQMAAMADPMKEVLDKATAECDKYGYSRRATTELNQLAATPDKERGSVMSTALSGINIFKNAAVRERTKFSDFCFKDLRGMKDPITGEMKPISVYLSVNQVDALALNVITGIFVELMSNFLIANKPGDIMNDGTKVGPFPVLFVLDEFPQLPKLQAVINGPAVGRGQKVSYLFIGQDLGQISGKYGKDDLETIITTTAAKVILAQNNEQTAERFSKMIGTRTIEVASSSRTEGLSQQTNPFAANVSRSYQSTNVVQASSMMSLDMLKQYVLMQGFLNKPILADSPRWYLDKDMLKKRDLPQAPWVPYWIVAQRPDNELKQAKNDLEEQERNLLKDAEAEVSPAEQPAEQSAEQPVEQPAATETTEQQEEN